MESTQQSDRETYRAIVLGQGRIELLLAPAVDGFLLPSVEIPRWLPLVQTARVLERHDDGRANRVQFTRKLERGSLGYTLEYTYSPDTYTVCWTTPRTSNVVLSGEARFAPLSSRACSTHAAASRTSLSNCVPQFLRSFVRRWAMP